MFIVSLHMQPDKAFIQWSRAAGLQEQYNVLFSFKHMSGPES